MANNTLKYRRIDPDKRDRLRREWNQPVLWPVILLVVVLLASLIPAVMVYRRHERGTAR
jgi:oligopeptide transport system substrate-binding protein